MISKSKSERTWRPNVSFVRSEMIILIKLHMGLKLILRKNTILQTICKIIKLIKEFSDFCFIFQVLFDVFDQ